MSDAFKWMKDYQHSKPKAKAKVVPAKPADVSTGTYKNNMAPGQHSNTPNVRPYGG